MPYSHKILPYFDIIIHIICKAMHPDIIMSNQHFNMPYDDDKLLYIDFIGHNYSDIIIVISIHYNDIL